jgi:large subunit ribosomal protein L24
LQKKLLTDGLQLQNLQALLCNNLYELIDNKNKIIKNKIKYSCDKMEKEFSTHWISSSQPRKQRKYRFNAPIHIKSGFFNSHLSQELRKKYGKRSFRVVTGDKVKIMRGQFKNIEGKVERINAKSVKIYVAKAEMNKKDGSKAFYPIDPSNVMITELNLNDKERQKRITKKQEKK